MLVNGWVEGSEPSLTALLSVTGSVSHLIFSCTVGVLNVLKDSIVQSLRNVRPVLCTVVADQLNKNLVFLLRPFRLVSSQLLNEKPSLVTLLGVFGWHYFRNMLPILVIELLYKFGILDHECK